MNELNEHDPKLDTIEKKLEKNTELTKKNGTFLEEYEQQLYQLKTGLQNLSKAEKMHFDFLTNKLNRIEQKIDSNFKFLDEKMDCVREKMTTDVTDMMEKFSIVTAKAMENIENKMKGEIEERKMEVSKVKGLSDYDRIVLKNLESRITILEEETQKYQVH